jgi:hypothetical protein
MKISHSAITSSIFELVKTVELDIRLGDDSWSIRIELLQDAEAKDHFRCHVWELELFRLTPTFPQDEMGQPAHTSDDVAMVDRGIPRSRIAYPREDIIAADVDAALRIVLDDLKQYLKHVTGEEAA